MRETANVDAANALVFATSMVTIQQERGEEEAEVAVIPPPANRRSRLKAREISSRFMSPLQNSNSFRIPSPSPAAARSLDGSSSSDGITTTTANRPVHKQPPQRAKPPPPPTSLHKDLSSKENDSGSGGTRSELQQCRNGIRAASRPNTPIVATTISGEDRDRIVPSRYRLDAQTCLPQRPPRSPGTAVSSTAAAKLLQQATKSNANHDVDDTAQTNRISKSIDHHSSHILSSDVRSSMPEVDRVLPTTLWQDHASLNDDVHSSTGSKFSATSPCSRSLDSSSSSSWLSHSTRRDVAVASLAPATPSKKNSNNNQVGMGSLCLPPHHPSSIKPGATDARKGGRKLVFSHQEDVHSLKLLYNHYLQWRFTNAKAQLFLHSQKMDTERRLYSLGIKISEMHDLVKRRRMELRMLQSMNILSTIAESQTPYLDEWSALEEDYSTSLSGVIDALLNLSLRLPISDGMKVGATDFGDILDSAERVIEMIVSCIKSFMVKAEEIQGLSSEIARVIGEERAHMHDCGDSLLKIYASQVEECSLRGHLVQLRGHENGRPISPSSK